MTRELKSQSLPLDIPSNLDAGTVSAVHASLVAGLELAETEDANVAVALGTQSEDCSALALQLLASAHRSFPAGTLTIDERGTRALATLTNT